MLYGAFAIERGKLPGKTKYAKYVF